LSCPSSGFFVFFVDNRRILGMKRLVFVHALVFSLFVLAGGAGAQAADSKAVKSKAGYRTLDWDALLPADFQPESLFEGIDLDKLQDWDPRAKGLMDKLRALWSQAPVVEKLDGQRIRLPGFVVPVEAAGERVRSFLLVPYYGACIHVPPPPANQTVYVRLNKEMRLRYFDAVWVAGTMRVERASTELADAGYTLLADTVVPYEE
jgi:hypothetical protein